MENRSIQRGIVILEKRPSHMPIQCRGCWAVAEEFQISKRLCFIRPVEFQKSSEIYDDDTDGATDGSQAATIRPVDGELPITNRERPRRQHCKDCRRLGAQIIATLFITHRPCSVHCNGMMMMRRTKTASQTRVAPRIVVQRWQYAPDVVPDMPQIMLLSSVEIIDCF